MLKIMGIIFASCIALLLSACQQSIPSTTVNPQSTPTTIVKATPTKILTFRDQIKRYVIREVEEIRLLEQHIQSGKGDLELTYEITADSNDSHFIYVTVFANSNNEMNANETFYFVVRNDFSEIKAIDPNTGDRFTIAEWRKWRAMPSPTPNSPRPMPQTIDFIFEPLFLDDVIQRNDRNDADGSFIQRIRLGHFKGKSIEMNFYKTSELDDTAPPSGCFLFEKNTYCVDQLALDFNNPEYIQNDWACIQIDQWIGDSKSGYYVLAGVELYAAPGNYAYLIYEAKSRKWRIWHDWSMTVTDLNGDGTKDVIMQFPGLHNNRADVYVARLNKGQLERSESMRADQNGVNDGLKLVNGGNSYTAVASKGKKGFEIELCADLNEDGKAFCDVYRFHGWQLKKVRSYTE